MIPCQDLKILEAIKSQTPKRSNTYQSKVLKHEYIIAKSSSLSVSWKVNTSLTQKDTMDRGDWIKNSERKAWGGLKRTKKCKMAWEWGTNEYFYLPYVTILWCSSWKLLEDKGKNETHIPGLERFILTLKYWFPFS